MRKVSFRLLAVVALLVLGAMTLGPLGLRPHTPLPHQLEHAIGFGVFGLLLGVAFRPRWLLIAVAVVAVAGGLELLQLIIPNRDARLLDFLVKASAGCIGIFVIFGADKLRRNLERRH